MLTPFVLLSIAWVTVASASERRLVFDDLKDAKGSIKYLVFKGKDGFPDQAEKSFLQGSLPATKAADGVVLLLPDDTYAVSVIHDQNDNGKLDTNFLGIPQEGFGFSNNPRIFFGPPSFSSASFDSKDIKVIKIQMKYL